MWRAHVSHAHLVTAGPAFDPYPYPPRSSLLQARRERSAQHRRKPWCIRRWLSLPGRRTVNRQQRRHPAAKDTPLDQVPQYPVQRYRLDTQAYDRSTRPLHEAAPVMNHQAMAKPSTLTQAGPRVRRSAGWVRPASESTRLGTVPPASHRLLTDRPAASRSG